MTQMVERMKVIAAMVSERRLKWWLITIGFTAFYYIAMLLGVVIRLGHLPNFVQTYDWLGNVITVIESTPSLRDTAMIVNGEWLLEVGYMNYEFGNGNGNGIAEWSLFLLPTKLVGVLALGALLATRAVVVESSPRGCLGMRFGTRLGKGFGMWPSLTQVFSGVGTGFVALSSVTLSWVVCCSTPTWVVGLAMMGVGVSTALWLEPLGVWLMVVGFAALLASIYFAVGQRFSDRIALQAELSATSAV